MSNSLNPTGRFSSRVADYAKFRPDYPRQLLSILADSIHLSPDWIVADLGCGTGISSRLFLENGNRVMGVEPNDDMRQAAVDEFIKLPKFSPVKGMAEATTLPDRSVDLVVAAQAFHWFDRPAFAREGKRILRSSPGGYVMLMWNSRLTDIGPFAREYDQLLMRYGTDYREVAYRTPVTTEELSALFGAPVQLKTAPNFQAFDFDQLCGRVRSSSYTPQSGQPGYDELFAGLKVLFDQYAQQGSVRFDYQTEIYLAKLV